MPPIIGPYRTINTAEGHSAPWYIIPFDKKGRCKAPFTREHLMEAIRSEGFTHAFVFAHGWNNDWKVASQRYIDFIGGFTKLRHELGVAVDNDYKPLLVGVFWPSTSLLMPWEHAPEFAAIGNMTQEMVNTQDALASEDDQTITDLANALCKEDVDRFYALVDSKHLNADEARELAALLAPLLDNDNELGTTPEISAEELTQVWMAGAPAATPVAVEDDDDSFGTVGETSGQPQAAAIWDKLDPRHAIRMLSVWKMKDRAGRVGSLGVSPLLIDMMNAGTQSMHLIGHSYGAKVILSATSFASLPHQLESMLLLQPAVSHLCFAENVDGNGTPGGYRVALERVRQPIMTTFSRHDVPLTKTFHLALRRETDLGEQLIAGAAPSRFAALGGYGPSGINNELGTVAMRDPSEPYPELDRQDIKILALQGDRTISGHGDISNRSTWWALYEQARR